MDHGEILGAIDLGANYRSGTMRWISKGWMVHAMDQWTIEGAMDGSEAIEGTMDCASGG
jgi:hypothetical protein